MFISQQACQLLKEKQNAKAKLSDALKVVDSISFCYGEFLMREEVVRFIGEYRSKVD